MDLNKGGAFAPGASPGALTITGDSTWGAGSAYDWQINNAIDAEGADPGWDMLNVGGKLTLTATPAQPMIIRLRSLGLNNAAGPVADFDNQTARSWRIASAAGGVSGFDPAAIALDSSGIANALGVGGFTISKPNDNDLVLTFNPISPDAEITWANPTAIDYGTKLGSNQLNATATTPGQFAYTPAAGTVLPAGTQTLKVVFTPLDLTKSPVSKQVTLVVNPIPVTIVLGSLAHTYDGKPKSAAYSTVPSNIFVTLAYNGSTTPPTDAGGYSVECTLSNPNYTGYAAGKLVISKAAAKVTLGNLNQMADGTPKTATATTVPAGLPVEITYGGGTAPTTVGTYTVVGTVTSPNYVGNATANMTLIPLSAVDVTITWPTPAAINYGTRLGVAQLNANSSVPGTFAYTPPAGTTLNAGTSKLTAIFTPTDLTRYKVATSQVDLIVNKLPATVTLGSLNQASTGNPVSVTATTIPPGLTAKFSYGLPSGPFMVNGPVTYQVVGTIEEMNYTGSAQGTLTVTDESDPDVVVGWGSSLGPVMINGKLLRGVQTVAAGPNYGLATKKDGTIVAWGANAYGATLVPSNLQVVTAVAAGHYHGMALLASGQVVVWGDTKNEMGVKNVPAYLINGATVGISAGYGHALALTGEGVVVAWGLNKDRQTDVPAQLSTPLQQGIPVYQIAAGWYHNLVVTSDGTVVAWGKNTSKQTTVPVGLRAIDVAAGADHSVALLTDTTVKVWGANNDQSVTKPPSGLTGVIAIAAGDGYTLAMKGDGSVVAWGKTTATIPPRGLTAAQFGIPKAITAGQGYPLAIVRQPTIGSLTPASVIGGMGQPLTITLTDGTIWEGPNILPESRVYWNGTPLGTTFTSAPSGPSLAVTVPANLLPSPANGIATAQITIVNPGNVISAPKPFTIKSSQVGGTESQIAAPGQPVVVETRYGSGSDLSTTFVSGSTNPVTVTTAVYTSNPIAGTTINAGGGYVDLQLAGAGPNDKATVQIYYPETVTGAAEAALVARYYVGANAYPLLSSGGVTPIKTTTDYLEGIVSGGRFTVVFDNTSSPKITELTGTVIAMAVNQEPAAAADVVSVASGTTLNIAAPGILSNDQDPDGDPLHGKLVSGTAHGELAFHTDGSFVYTPEEGFVGSDSFSYLADDGYASSEVVSVEIQVTAPNAPPIIPNQSTTYGAAFAYDIPSAALDLLQSNPNASLAAAGLPPGMTLDYATRTINGISTAAGEFLVSITATDTDSDPIQNTTVPLRITVAGAPLTVKANDMARDYGQPTPPPTGTIEGVLNNDLITATFSVEGMSGDAVGTFPIVANLVDPERKLRNYEVASIPGTLTVMAIPPVGDAGPDQLVEATGPAGAEVILSSEVQTDPDNAIVSYQWREEGIALGAEPEIRVTLGAGVHLITLTATDLRGLLISDSLQVTVVDTQPPTLVIPAPIIAGNDPWQCGGVVAFSVAATDTVSDVTVVSTPPSGSVFPTGVTTVTTVATDASGNQATESFTVTVNDTEAPSLTVPASIVVGNTPGQCGGVVNFTVTGADNCSSVTVVSDPATGSLFPMGATTVTSTATDASGNITTKTFTVTVNDMEAPTMTTPAPLVVNAAEGRTSEIVSFTVTAVDNCSPASVVSTPASGSSFPLGTTTVTSVSTDASGNTATKSFTVTVIAASNLQISRVVVLAKNSIWISQNSKIYSGDLIVNNVSSGPGLNDGVELSIGQSVTTPAGYTLRANRIAVRQKAFVNGDVYFNQLDDAKKSTITGLHHTPLLLPVVGSMPPFQTAVSGEVDVTAHQNQTVTLAPGSYRDVVLKQKCTLILTGGGYNLRNLDLGQNVDVLVNGPTEVRVAQAFAMDQKSYFGPQTGSSIGAKDIVVYVNGINGKNGNQYADREVAKIGQNCVVRANFYAPNGTISIGQKTVATGAFLASEVNVGENATLSLGSAFGLGDGQNPRDKVAPAALKPGLDTQHELSMPSLMRLQYGAEGVLELRFNGSPGVEYLVETTDELDQWTALPLVLMGPEGIVRMALPESSFLQMRFYRVTHRRPLQAPR